MSIIFLLLALKTISAADRFQSKLAFFWSRVNFHYYRLMLKIILYIAQQSGKFSKDAKMCTLNDYFLNCYCKTGNLNVRILLGYIGTGISKRLAVNQVRECWA